MKLVVAQGTGVGDESATVPLSDDVDSVHGLRGVPPGSSLQTGDTIGRYVIEDIIGRGGMGVVYRAHDESLGRYVAVKVLRRRGHGDVHVARLRREAQALAQLSHENVVAVFEVGAHDGDVFIAMELVEGTPLDAWLAEGTHPWKEVVRVLGSAGRGLAAAHAEGLVHRDFKPANVMLGSDGRVRVLDFGLARGRGDATTAGTSGMGLAGGSVGPSGDGPSFVEARAELASPLTDAGTVMGTPAYMAPEQWLLGEADARTDQYAFAVTLFEALYGRRPYSGDMDALRDKVERGAIGDRPRGPVPPRLWRVIKRGLSVRREDRYPDLDAMLTVLTQATQAPRWAWAAAGFAIVGLLGAAALTTDTEPCAAASAAFDAQWNPARRTALAVSLGETGLAYAPATATQVAERIDTYGVQWTEARTTACEAGAADPRLDRRMQCLDAALVRVSTLLDVLAAPDPASTRRAVAAVSHLPAPDNCLDERAEPALPEGASAEVAAIASDLAALEARTDIAGSEGGLATVDGLLARARVTDHAPLVADVLVTRGLLLRDAGQYELARGVLEEGFWLAQEAGADLTAARAGTLLVYTLAQHLSDIDGARTWARHTTGALQRAPDATSVAAAYHNAIGVMHERAGEPDEALAAYSKVAELARAEYGENHLTFAIATGNRGNVMRALGRLDEARALHEHALQLRESALGKSHPDIGRALADLASILAGQGELDRALEVSLRAVAVSENALGAVHPQTAMVVANLGSIYERLGRQDDAAATYERALRDGKAALGEDHPNIAIILHNLGGIRRLQGRLDEAVRLLEDSHIRLEAIWGDAHPQVAASLINLGIAHHELGRPEQALEEFERARSIAEAAHGPEHELVAAAANHVGNAMRGLGRHDEALAQHRAAVHIWTQLMGGEAGDVAIGLTGVGQDLAAMDEPDAAIEALRRAIRIADGNELDPSVAADARGALAHVLAETGGDSAEIRTLAHAAAVTYRSSGGAGVLVADGLDAWIAKLPAVKPTSAPGTK